MFQIMNPRLLLVAILFAPFIASAQFEVEDLVTIPKTPEAAAFTEYANTASVSLYTGKASVSVPIDGLAGHKLSHPVSLTYLTGGIKVQQEAGVAGLGWNLNVGGMVTRNVNGLPDDYSGGDHSYYPFYSELPFQWGGGGPTPPIFDVYRHFRDNDYGIYYSDPVVGKTYEGTYQPFDDDKWHEIYYHYTGRGDIEISPDTYSFSAGGISGTIVINYDDQSAYCIEHPDYQVEVQFGATGTEKGQKPIEAWTITDNQGTIYQFSAIETTTVGGDDEGSGRPAFRYRTYASGWYLTQIHNPFAKDTYVFNYEGYTTAEYNMLGHGTTIGDRYAQGDDSDQYCGGGTTPNDPGTIHYQYAKNRLTSVFVNTTPRLELTYDANRLDLSTESMLDAIVVRDVLGQVINSYDFIYDYFGTPDVSDIRRDYISRLRLDEVLILGDGTSTETLSYAFDYDDQSLPDRDSFAQDAWGYYNGFDENQGLVPRNDLLTNPADHTGNRSVVGTKMRAGVLEKVHYPTGGSTFFEYTNNGYFGRNNVSTVDYVGNFDLDGGADPELTDPCDPQAGTEGAPFVQRGAMVIEETDTYTISLSASGGSGDAVQGAAIRLAYFAQCEATYPTDEGSFDFLELNPDNFGAVTTTLVPGKYHVLLINDQPGTRVSLDVSRVVDEDQDVTIPAGGLRVISKQNFDEQEHLANHTIYRYRDMTNSTSSISGVLHHRRNFEKVNRSEAIHSSLPVPCESLTRFASNQNTPTPNIVTYTTVSEMNIDEEGNSNGVTVYQFYNEDEGVGTRPFIKTKLKNGMPEIKKVFKAEEVDGVWQYDILLEEQNEYHIESLGGMVAYGFESQASAFLDPMLQEDPQDASKAKWVYAPMYFTSLGLSGGSSYTGIETIHIIASFTIDGTTYKTSTAVHDLTEGGTEGISGEDHLAPCSFNHNHNRTSTADESDVLEDIVNAVTTTNAIAAGLIAADDFVMTLFNGETPDYTGLIEYDPLLIECFPQVTQIPITYKQVYSIPRSWLQQVSTTTIQHEDGAEIRTVRTYSYDDTQGTNQFQVQSITSEMANDRLETIQNYYPSEMSTVDPEVLNMSVLTDDNRVATPVRVERWVDGTLQSVKNTVYDEYGRPMIIQIAHGSSDLEDLEDRAEILAYDGYNNVTKMRGADGLLKHYVWGYNNYFPIAQIIGEEEDQIRNTIIANPPDDDGGHAYSATIHEALKSIPGTLVSTYVHDPGKGMVRQTDPNGRTTHYEYDSFGRLLRVIDHEGHVLSQNEYHFANQND